MFTLFPLLPTEIRLGIWRIALLSPAVLFFEVPDIFEPNARSEKPKSKRPLMTVTPVGPVPSLAGAACRESRFEMERVMPLPFRMSASPSDTRIIWLNWNTTVIHFGGICNAARTLFEFTLPEIAQIVHVALEMTTCDQLDIGRATGSLARFSHGLRTLTAHCQEGSVPPHIPPHMELQLDRNHLTPTAKTAELYTARAVFDCEGADISEAPQRNELWRYMLRDTFLFRKPHIMKKQPRWKIDRDGPNYPKINLLRLVPEEY